MLEALRETGWANYSLFLRPDGLLVGYLESPDFEQALRGMSSQEVNSRWQREMSPFFEDLDGRRPDEGLFAPGGDFPSRLAARRHANRRGTKSHGNPPLTWLRSGNGKSPAGEFSHRLAQAAFSPRAKAVEP